MKSPRRGTRCPILGDIPVLGYLFQEHLNARTKRNLLIFVTPTILEQRYGTGLEDQVYRPASQRRGIRRSERLAKQCQRRRAPRPDLEPPGRERLSGPRHRAGSREDALHEHGKGPGLLRTFVVG